MRAIEKIKALGKTEQIFIMLFKKTLNICNVIINMKLNLTS